MRGRKRDKQVIVRVSADDYRALCVCGRTGQAHLTGDANDCPQFRRASTRDCGCGDPEDCAHDEQAARMRARALRAGRKPWKWSELQPLTVDGFRSRPWLLSAYRYEDDGVVADVLARLAGVL